MNNPLSKNIIIDFDDRDWYYETKKPDGTINSFFIMRNKGGYKWLELWGNIDDYDSLVAYITNLSDATIVENNKEIKRLKYHRNHCEFSLTYIDYVDLWIDPNWDGEPYIEFAFVSKDHPQFKTYAYEALALCEIIETNLQKRRKPNDCSQNKRGDFMDWKQLLSESEGVKVIESGMLGAVEWKHYANGLLTFFGQGTISNFLYELTYPGYHDEDHTECHPYWRSWFGKEINTPVKYVYIGEGITEIEDGAFEACYIEEIFIPNSVIKIGAKVFSDNNLEAINLPNNLESIGYRCFEKSRKLKSLFIPASVKKLGSIGGKYVSAIEEIIVDKNNTNYTVVDGILYTADMTQLLWCPASVTGTLQIPNSVKRVDADAFDNCSFLKEVIFSENPIILGTRCFNNTALHKLVLPKEVEMEYFGILGCGYHEHPVTGYSIPCEADNLVVYIDKDCTAWDYFKKEHIQIFGEPIEYNREKMCAKDKQQKKKNNFFSKIFGK